MYSFGKGIAESLGGVETLITYPVTQTHADVPKDQPEKNGINERVLRLSVGIESEKDLIPLWVADMDFKVSSYIQEALQKQAEHGIFGYSEAGEEYFEAVRSWMQRRHQWQVERNWLVKTPGIVFALAMAVKAFAREEYGAEKN